MSTPILSCDTCAEGGFPRNECPKSKRPCGHHCNCIWVHDHCHWCDAEYDEDGELLVPVIKLTPAPERVLVSAGNDRTDR